MLYLHSVSFVLHIMLGSLALILFWVPIFTKKGQLNHKKFGHYYKVAMYGVALTGVLMALLVIASPLVIKHEYANHEHAAHIALRYRYFSVFLLYLALLNFTATRHGIAVLESKSSVEMLRRVNYLGPLWGLALGGLLIFAMGLYRDNTLFIVFGLFGSLIGSNMLRYCLQKEIGRNTWVLEHIGSMIGSGIGAYTAFLAFGARTLLSDLGQWQIAFWIAPGVIGGLAAYLICKHYGQVLGVSTSS